MMEKLTVGWWRRPGRILVALATIAAFASPALASPSAPLARTNGLVKAFLAVRHAPKGAATSVAETSSNCKAYTDLDGYFDFHTMISDAIAPSKSKLSASQLAIYHREFRALIRMVTYPSSGDFFRKAKYSFKPGAVHGADATVSMHAYEAADDWDTNVAFHWRLERGTWRLVDVGFDGKSLVKDYQNQFSRIIDKDGAKGFIQKVNDKYKEKRADAQICAD